MSLLDPAVNRETGGVSEGEDGGVDTLVHLRMTRPDWLATGGAPDVVVEGLEAALPLFDLPGD